MPPSWRAALLAWLVDALTEALRGENPVEETRAEVTLQPQAGGVITEAGFRSRNSNAVRRPSEALHTVAGWSLGDDPRGGPVILPKRPQAAHPTLLKLLPPQPFASLATQPENTYYATVEGGEPFVIVPSKALVPFAGEGGAADYPCEDAVREKLWRRRGKRGSPYPAWEEWGFITQEYPSESHPYQSGVDEAGAEAGAYVAGIMSQDWRVLDAADMPLPLDGDGNLLLPDDVGVLDWLVQNPTVQRTVTVQGPELIVATSPDPEDRTTLSSFTAFTETILDAAISDLFGAASEFEQPVKRYYRDAAVQVGTVDYLRWAADVTDSGVFDWSEDGTWTVNAGETLWSLGPPWWHQPDIVPAEVVGNHTAQTDVQVSFADTTYRDFLADNEVWIRFMPTGQEPIVAGPLVELVNDGGTYYLRFENPVTVPSGAQVNRYGIAIPKSGSRMYYWRDEGQVTWSAHWLVQVSRLITLDPNTVVYVVAPAFTAQVERTVTLHEGNDDTGTPVSTLHVNGAPRTSTSELITAANTFHPTQTGFSGTEAPLLGGVGWNQAYSTPAPITGDLPGCSFLRSFTARETRWYAFEGPVAVTTYKPQPGETLEDTLFERFHYRDLPLWRVYMDEVNPIIYDGPLGKLHNPGATVTQSTWCGLEFDSRWYAADAFTDPDGRLVGVVLLDDLTLMVSVNGIPTWTGSVSSLVCDPFTVTYGLPNHWPNGGTRNHLYTVAPHYNFAHPSWPFRTALVGPFAVRAPVTDDRSTMPVTIAPVF